MITLPTCWFSLGNSWSGSTLTLRETAERSWTSSTTSWRFGQPPAHSAGTFLVPKPWTWGRNGGIILGTEILANSSLINSRRIRGCSETWESFLRNRMIGCLTMICSSLYPSGCKLVCKTGRRMHSRVDLIDLEWLLSSLMSSMNSHKSMALIGASLFLRMI